MTEINDTTPSRICKECGSEFPETSEFFPPYKVKHYSYLRTSCRACWRKGRKAHSDDTREADRARRTKWRKENPEKIKAQKKRSHVRRRDHNNERTRQWTAVHKIEVNARRRGEYAINPQPAIQRALEFQRNNPEYARTRTAKRRAREIAAEGNFTKEDIRLQYKSQRGNCWHCGKPVGTKYHADHLYPLSLGGSNSARNIVISCPFCNLSKGDKPTWEWNGRLL